MHIIVVGAGVTGIACAHVRAGATIKPTAMLWDAADHSVFP